jgi:hypothetical protein
MSVWGLRTSTKFYHMIWAIHRPAEESEVVQDREEGAWKIRDDHGLWLRTKSWQSPCHHIVGKAQRIVGLNSECSGSL